MKPREFPRGVYRKGKKFQSSIRIDGKLICLGTFETVEQAESAYKTSAKINFGEFIPI